MFIIQNIFLPIAGTVAMLFIIIGGFRYIVAAKQGHGDKSVDVAKKTITNAIVGLIIIILSYIIVTVIINALKGNV